MSLRKQAASLAIMHAAEVLQPLLILALPDDLERQFQFIRTLDEQIEPFVRHHASHDEAEQPASSGERAERSP